MHIEGEFFFGGGLKLGVSFYDPPLGLRLLKGGKLFQCISIAFSVIARL